MKQKKAGEIMAKKVLDEHNKLVSYVEESPSQLADTAAFLRKHNIPFKERGNRLYFPSSRVGQEAFSLMNKYGVLSVVYTKELKSRG